MSRLTKYVVIAVLALVGLRIVAALTARSRQQTPDLEPEDREAILEALTAETNT